MKTTKKLLALLLAALIVTAGLPVAFAAPSKTLLSGNAGKNVRWVLDEAGVLTVSGFGPIEDELTYEYGDDGEYVIETTIGDKIYEYFEEQTESLDVSARHRLLFDLVQEIIIEEGITEIPDSEFILFYPRTISLPRSLEFLGCNAFDATFAEDITIRSDLSDVVFWIGAYEADSTPFDSLDEAIQTYIDYLVASDAFDRKLEPVWALSLIFDYQNGISDYLTEDEIPSVLEDYNESFGSNAATLDELATVALPLLNRYFGLNYQRIDEVFVIEQEEWGEEAYLNDELQAIISEENSQLYDGRLSFITFGYTDSEDDLIVYPWLTITAPSGSEVIKNCKANGVFYFEICNYCGQIHYTASRIHRYITVIHKVLYFFSRVFSFFRF